MNHADLNFNAWRVWAVCLVAGAVVTGLAYFTVLKPVQEIRRQDTALAQQAAEQADEARRLQTRHDQLSARLLSIRETLDDQQITLGESAQLNQRIAWLIELARNAGLEVLQLQPGSSQPNEHYHLRSLRLEAGATLAQHAAFLEKLHKTFPDMSVVGLDLTQAVGRDDARPNAVFSIVWFTTVPDGTDNAAPGAI